MKETPTVVCHLCNAETWCGDVRHDPSCPEANKKQQRCTWCGKWFTGNPMDFYCSDDCVADHATSYME